MVKSCHGECSFAVGVGEKFVVKKKGEDRGPALEVTDAMAVHDILFFCPTKAKWSRRFSSIRESSFNMTRGGGDEDIETRSLKEGLNGVVAFTVNG